MWFFTTEDFYKYKDALRRMFKEMNQDGKLFYMYYVYANVNMGLNCKNAIWDYLNEYDTNGLKLAETIRKDREKYERKRNKEQVKIFN